MAIGLRTRLCLVLVALLVASTFSIGTAQGASTDPTLERDLQRLKERYGFQDWGGKVKLEGKRVRGIHLGVDALSALGKVTFRSQSPERAYFDLESTVAASGPVFVWARVSVLHSWRKAQEAILEEFLYSSYWPTHRLGDSQYDVGDACFVPPTRTFLRFARNNVFVDIRGRDQGAAELILKLARELDRQIVGMLVDEDGQTPEQPAGSPVAPAVAGSAERGAVRPEISAAVDALRQGKPGQRPAALAMLMRTREGRQALSALVAELNRTPAGAERGRSLPTPEAAALLKEAADAARGGKEFDETMGALLRGLPEDQGRAYALQEARRMADEPDAEPEKLAFWLAGLGPEEEAPQIPLLCRILRASKDERVRTACVRALARWITAPQEDREDALEALREELKSPHAEARAAAARGLGASEDVRQVGLLEGMLGDGVDAVRRAAAESICKLLGWPVTPLRSREDTMELVDRVRRRLPAVLKALEALETARQTP